MTIYILETADLTEGQLEMMNSKLPIERQQRSQRIKNPVAQRESIAASYLALYGLVDGNTDRGLIYPDADILLSKSKEVFKFSSMIGWPTDEAGKPFSSGIQKENKTVFISISHSDGLVAAAIADEPVGADVQRIPTSSPEQLMRLVSKFHPKEQERFASLSEEELPAAFCRLWACKESVMKLCGRGLSLPLSSFYMEDTDSSNLDGRKIRLFVKGLKGAFFAAAFWE